MCELLGMSANVPTDICFSFTGLARRGGETGPHQDGWGIAFYEGDSARIFQDTNPSHNSEMAKFIQHYPIKSTIIISHIRLANSGRVCLANTHPFTRELWGKQWVYAHNGQLKGVKKLPLKYYRPVGTTDSEHTFCWILDQIRERFPRPPSRQSTLWRFIQSLCDTIHDYGVFNLLLSDSRHTYAYCGKELSWLTRRAPFGPAHLVDAEVILDFKEVTTPNDIVTVIATKPLTKKEKWNIMQRKDFLVFQDGEVVNKD